jgi:hypothetical protein
MEMAAYVLQEVAGCDRDGGSEASALPGLVARRRGIAPDADEVEELLALLEGRGLVVRVADRYVLSPLMRLRAPKASDGTIVMSGQAWIRLSASLDLTELRP